MRAATDTGGEGAGGFILIREYNILEAFQKRKAARGTLLVRVDSAL
jgi:hypothetical protein